MQCESVVCESVERAHGVNPWLMRIMNRLCCDCWYLWKMQYVLGNLKQIDDILIPQIEEEIEEVSKSLGRVQQYPEPLLRGNRSVSGMSLYETGHSIQILCSQSDVLVRAQFDAHARLFSVVLSLTFMSTDHVDSHHDVVVLKLRWSSIVSQSKQNLHMVAEL